MMGISLYQEKLRVVENFIYKLFDDIEHLDYLRKTTVSSTVRCAVLIQRIKILTLIQIVERKKKKIESGGRLL
jgi:hypothetical protein